MGNLANFFIALVILFSAFTCGKFKPTQQQNTNTQQQTQKPEPKDQYRIAENYSGNKSQMIDLIAGPATFDIKYDGSSRFLALLLNNEGGIVDTLADVIGSYKGEKSINVPLTTAYVVDVKCEGIWSIYRK